MSQKKIILRAFEITSFDMTIDKMQVVPMLINKLKDSLVRDRLMLLNENNPQGERDLFSNYLISDTNTVVSATMMRVLPNDQLEQLSQSYLEKTKFNIEELTRNTSNGTDICKEKFYICLNGQYLITAMLPRNITVSRIQTYISWILNCSTFSFTPLVKNSANTKLSDLVSIRFLDPFKPIEEDMDLFQNSFHLTDKLKEFIVRLFKDQTSLTEIDLEKIISAELALKIHKPRDMTKEDYQHYYGAILKPISDVKNVIFKDKNGNNIKGSDIEVIKSVEIETTDNGFISEQQLYNEMAIFLRELD